MGASDSSLPASASLEEERPETTEGRSMRLEPLDPSQALDASYGPIYFEGKRPVTLFIGVLFILIGAPAVRILWGSWRHEWITFFVAPGMALVSLSFDLHVAARTEPIQSHRYRERHHRLQLLRIQKIHSLDCHSRICGQPAVRALRS